MIFIYILAFLIFASVIFINVQEKIPVEKIKNSIKTNKKWLTGLAVLVLFIISYNIYRNFKYKDCLDACRNLSVNDCRFFCIQKYK